MPGGLMKLELASFPIKDVRFTNRSNYRDGLLEVNKEELLDLVLKNKLVAEADLDLALPGQQTRIIRIRDIVEPRVKVSGSGGVFPGVLSPVKTAGEGRTNRLSGISVIASVDYTPTILSGSDAQSSSILDMWGPGARLTPFGSTCNLVLVLRLADGITELEAQSAILLAECSVAQRLAEITKEIAPPQVEVFDSPDIDSSLPRVVYVLCCMTTWHSPHSGYAYYGLPIRESLPTYVHPNEFLDGILTKDARKGHSGEPSTWEFMNNPVILLLLREHGKRINFLGVILQRTRFETEFGKQVSAEATSQMARLLRADGAIFTRISASGNNLMDVMLTIQACERKAVKTVFITPEYSGVNGTEPTLLFYVPEATAMVSSDSTDQAPKLPAPAKVIGAGDKQMVVLRPGDRPFLPWQEHVCNEEGVIAGGYDWLGRMNHLYKTY